MCFIADVLVLTQTIENNIKPLKKLLYKIVEERFKKI